MLLPLNFLLYNLLCIYGIVICATILCSDDLYSGPQCQGHDAEIKQAKESGNHYGGFRLAVRDRNDETQYFPVRCFGKLGESVTNIKKGTIVIIGDHALFPSAL